MSFSEAVDKAQAAIFARLGEDAAWPGVFGTVRVIFREQDGEADLPQGGAALVVIRTIKVRRSEVPAPAAGQVVTLLDADGNAAGTYKVARRPRLNRQRVWLCEVAPT